MTEIMCLSSIIDFVAHLHGYSSIQTNKQFKTNKFTVVGKFDKYPTSCLHFEFNFNFNLILKRNERCKRKTVYVSLSFLTHFMKIWCSRDEDLFHGNINCRSIKSSN